MTVTMFKYLHKELIIFLLCVLISTIILVIAQHNWQDSFDQNQQASNTMTTAKHRYQNALERKRLLETYESRFTQLQKNGTFGEEQRLQWVDAIEFSARSQKIPYLKYTIDKRLKVDSPQLLRAFPDIDIFISPMQLEMQLLHEGDLFALLNTLQSSTENLFDIQQCAITRNISSSSSVLTSGTDRNFSARCTLNWYTLQNQQPRTLSKSSVRRPGE